MSALPTKDGIRFLPTIFGVIMDPKLKIDFHITVDGSPRSDEAHQEGVEGDYHVYVTLRNENLLQLFKKFDLLGSVGINTPRC